MEIIYDNTKSIKSRFKLKFACFEGNMRDSCQTSPHCLLSVHVHCVCKASLGQPESDLFNWGAEAGLVSLLAAFGTQEGALMIAGETFEQIEMV